MGMHNCNSIFASTSVVKISTKIIKYHEINFSIAADHIPYHGMFNTGLSSSQQHLDASLDKAMPWSLST